VVIALCALLLQAAAVQAQLVSGYLRDADAGLPIAGARVVLLDPATGARLETVTNAQGRFAIQASAAGEYVLVAEHTGYASVMSDPFRLEVGATVEQDLGIKLLQPDRGPEGAGVGEVDPAEAARQFAALLVQACEGRFDPERHAILVGVVRDSVSGVPLPGTVTALEWEGAPDSTAQVRVEYDPGTGAPHTINRIAGLTDEDGAYMFCNAPAGRRLTVVAEAAASRARTGIELNPGTVRKHDLALALTTETEPGDVLGRVIDAMTGKPIDGVEVSLKGTRFKTITNPAGGFAFADVPWGVYVLEADHLAYQHTEQAFRVQGGRAHQIEVQMATDPIELDPIKVAVRPRAWFSGIQGLQHRIQNGFGYILTRDDIEARGASTVGEALRGIPGVRVRPLGARGTMVVFRNSRNLLGQACPPAIFMDGVQIRLDPIVGFNEFATLDVEAIEVYRGVSEIPGEFASANTPCGVLAIWTRRGMR